MANEAVIIELLGDRGDVVRFTCADATAIAKGTLCVITDPRTVAPSAADNGAFVGIACEEKVALDGQTSIGLYTHGIFDIVGDAGGTTVVGERVSISGANIFSKVAGADQLFADIGIVLETAGANERVAVLIGSGF